MRRITGEGVLVAEGSEHRRQRKLLNPAFASEHIKNLVPVFWRKGEELCRVLHDEAKATKGGYNVIKVLTRATLDIIGLAGNPLQVLWFDWGRFWI